MTINNTMYANVLIHNACMQISFNWKKMGVYCGQLTQVK